MISLAVSVHAMKKSQPRVHLKVYDGGWIHVYKLKLENPQGLSNVLQVTERGAVFVGGSHNAAKATKIASSISSIHASLIF